MTFKTKKQIISIYCFEIAKKKLIVNPKILYLNFAYYQKNNFQRKMFCLGSLVKSI